MKKNIKGIYLLEVIMFISVVMFNIFNIKLAFNVILIGSAIFSYIKFGFVKDNAYEKSNIIRVVIASLMAGLITVYALGVFTGFYKNDLDFNLYNILVGLVLPILGLISEEVIRYIVAKNSTKSVLPLVTLTIVFIILNIITQINLSYFNDRWLVFVLISTFILPIIAREMLCSYIAYKCSYMPNIVYRLLIEIGFHFIPILPNLGEYLYALVRILIPAAIFFLSSKVFKYHEKSSAYTRKASRRIILLPIIILVFIMIYLVSGLFKYKMIAVGSGSMEPEYYMGDAVIFEKKQAHEVKVGDILVFKRGRTVITHRIVSISKSNNSKYDITTKGDNNDNEDDYLVQKEDVLGVVKYSVKYVGYPTLWINKLIER